jgi:hypothetical protein
LQFRWPQATGRSQVLRRTRRIGAVLRTRRTRTDRRSETVVHQRRGNGELLPPDAADEGAGERLRRKFIRVLMLVAFLPVARVMFPSGGFRNIPVNRTRPHALRLLIAQVPTIHRRRPQ